MEGRCCIHISLEILKDPLPEVFIASKKLSDGCWTIWQDCWEDDHLATTSFYAKRTQKRLYFCLQNVGSSCSSKQRFKAFDAVEQRGRFTRILTQAIDYTDRLYELETAEFAYVSRQRFVIRAR